MKIRVIRIQIMEFDIEPKDFGRGVSEGQTMEHEHSKAISEPEEYFAACEDSNVIMDRMS